MQLAGELGAMMEMDDIGRKALVTKRMILRLQEPFNVMAGKILT
jgi:hypothetical protein